MSQILSLLLIYGPLEKTKDRRYLVLNILLEFLQILVKYPHLKGFFSIGFGVAAGFWDV